MSGEQAQGEEEDGWEEEGTTLCTIRPLQPLKGSPLMWCKGLKIVALKIETIEAQRWCRCEERSSLQQLSLQCGQ